MPYSYIVARRFGPEERKMAIQDFGSAVALFDAAKDVGVAAWECGGQWLVQQSADADCDRPMAGTSHECFASREAALVRAEALFAEVAA